MDDCREGEERRVGPYLKGMSNSQGWQAGGGERGRPLFNTNGEEGANWYCSFAGGVREVWGETHDGFMGTGEDRAARKTGHGFEDVICGIFPFPCLHGDALPLQLKIIKIISVFLDLEAVSSSLATECTILSLITAKGLSYSADTELAQFRNMMVLQDQSFQWSFFN